MIIATIIGANANRKPLRNIMDTQKRWKEYFTEMCDHPTDQQFSTFYDFLHGSPLEVFVMACGLYKI